MHSCWLASPPSPPSPALIHENCSQLLQRYRKRETYLEVNLGHVNEFRPDLLDMLTLRPVEYLPLFEQVGRLVAFKNRSSLYRPGNWHDGHMALILPRTFCFPLVL